MRKLMLFYMTLFVFAAVTGCSAQNPTITMMSYELEGMEVNVYTDAAMSIQEDSLSGTGLSLNLYYYGDDEGHTGNWYSIYRFEDNEWIAQPIIVEGNVSWNTIAIVVENTHPTEMSIDWEWLYGELTSGRYLFIKDFSNFRGSGDYDDYLLACEFTL